MIRRLVLATATAFLATGGMALAAPARTVTVTADQPATWEGGPGNGIGQGVSAVRCAPLIYECEDTLVDLKGAGDLTAEITGDDTAQDLDVAIYKSDAEGTAPAFGEEDNPMVEDISTNKDAKVTAKRLQPGFYVIRVRFYFAVASFYTGKATLVAPPPVVEPPAATPPPPPASQPPSQSKSSAKAKCRKKAKKIKNRKKRAKALKRCNRRG